MSPNSCRSSSTLIAVGDKFASYASLEDAMKKLGEETDSVFIRQESNKTKIPALKETVVYDRIMFACKQGRERKPEGKGARTQQRSVKLGCSARIRVMLKEVNDTWSLVVTLANLHHDTHTPCKEALHIFPETRKVNESLTVKALLQCPSVAARDVVKAVEIEQGKSILSKDVHNLRARLKENNGSTDPKKVDDILRTVCTEGGGADFGVAESGHFKYLCFQTAHMKQMLASYPDVLLMDVTYKTNIYLLPLLTIMCIDNNGRGHPVLHSFMSSEEQGMIVKSLEFFKTSFDWTKTSCFFVDKDFSEIGALSVVFPEKAVIVCAFHSAAAVKKALCNKGLSTQQAETIKSLFLEMRNALTEEEYNRAKSMLMEVSPEHIAQYFQVNWFDKSNLWAAHKLVGVGKLHVTTTNHCESYHQKIKQILHSKMELCDCLEALLQMDLALFRSSSFQNVRNVFTRPVSYGEDPVLGLIFNDLTPFAANLVYDQYRVMLKVPYSVTLNEGYYTLSYNGQDHATSCTTCSCPFFVNFSLPCRHIFCLRKHLSLPLYQAVPSGHRFKPRLLDCSVSIRGQVSSSVLSCDRRISTPEVKYKTSERVCKKMCSFLSLLGDSDFSNKLMQLESLFDSWTGGSHFREDIDASPASNVEDAAGIAAPSSVLPLASPTSNVEDAVGIAAPSSVLPLASPTSNVEDAVGIAAPSVLPLASPTSNVEGSVGIAEPSILPLASAFPDSDVVSSFGQVVLKPVRVKGRPKNRQNFTRRKRKASPLLSFSELPHDKKVRMLTEGAVHKLHDSLYSVDDVKDSVHLSSLLTCTDFSVIENLFEPLAWNVLQSRIADKKFGHLFLCGSCQEVDDGEIKMIQCECCCDWYHFSCVGYRSHFKVKKWFCNNCL